MNMEEKIDCLEKNGEGEKEVKEVVVEVEEDEEVVLPGFRFHPTDEELVGFYLRRKVDNKPLSIQIIKQIDIYKYDPWDLPKPSTVGGEKEWYFFCLRGRKYRNSIRPNRVTGSGFWKATGIDRPICSASNNECIGLKKSLVYYRGSAGKGTKTDWMMHEFRLPANNKSDANTSPSMQEAEVWTVCRIFKRNLSGKKYSTQGWKQSIANQTPTQTDSSSKTSSIDSDHTRGADNYTYMGCDNLQQDQHFPKNYFDDKSNNQAFGASQWSNSSVQVQQPLVANTTLPISITTPNLNANEFFLKDGNWDELGRMMEYMMEPSMQQDCIYYY